mgnify:CR=1 FL=1
MHLLDFLILGLYFAGMLAIHPLQVAVINEAFTPDAAEIERARRIVRATNHLLWR